MGTLTVRENIAFSAALRLPSTYTRRDRRQKVDLVIKELGLTHVADSKVSDSYSERNDCSMLFCSVKIYFTDWNGVYQRHFWWREEKN